MKNREVQNKEILERIRRQLDLIFKTELEPPTYPRTFEIDGITYTVYENGRVEWSAPCKYLKIEIEDK